MSVMRLVLLACGCACIVTLAYAVIFAPTTQGCR